MKEFFEDFDPLRSGTISQSQFIRVLASLGLTGLDGVPLTEAQMLALCETYRHPERRDLVMWKQFEHDVESGSFDTEGDLMKRTTHLVAVFTLSDLEKAPNIQASPQTIYEMPIAGTSDWSRMSSLSNEELQQTMQLWKTKCQQRRLDIAQPFRQFDK